MCCREKENIKVKVSCIFVKVNEKIGNRVKEFIFVQFNFGKRGMDYRAMEVTCLVRMYTKQCERIEEIKYRDVAYVSERKLGCVLAKIK